MRRAVMAAIVGMLGCGRLAFDAVDAQPQPRCPDAATQQPTPLGLARYVAPTGGSDSNPGTETAPWATIPFAVANVGAGETLVLLDGVYTERLVVSVNDRRIVAATDGGAIFDGGAASYACEITGTGVTLEGVHCRNGSPHSVSITNTTNVTVRRVTAHTSPMKSVFRVGASSFVLLEDVAAWGEADNGFLIASSSNVTLRRGFVRWDSSTSPDNAGIVLTNDTSDSLVENSVVLSSAPYVPSRVVVGISLYSASQQVDRNRLLGNVIKGVPDWGVVVSTLSSRIDGNRFTDTVVMACGAGFYQRTDADFAVERLTSVELVGNAAFVIDAHSFTPKAGNFEIQGSVRDSVLGMAPEGFSVSPEYLTSFTHTNNTLFAVTEPYRGSVSADPSEVIADPAYDTATHGYGAYLIRNRLGTGADVLYRYQDGVVTDEPLWPWPMEERILREAGSSVTYESGGGLWRTLPATACP